jgi:hypothetical protein
MAARTTSCDRRHRRATAPPRARPRPRTEASEPIIERDRTLVSLRRSSRPRTHASLRHQRCLVRTGQGPLRPCRPATVAAAVAEEWMGIVGATSIGLRPFAARKRDRPRFVRARGIEHVQFEFQRWEGPIGPWHEHFGKGRGQVRSLDGTEPLRSCNEVEVAKRLRTVRDHAFWFSGFGTRHIPEIWRPWLRECSRSAMPDWLAALDETIRARIASQAGGMPDVVAWNDRQSLRSALAAASLQHSARGPRLPRVPRRRRPSPNHPQSLSLSTNRARS